MRAFVVTLLALTPLVGAPARAADRLPLDDSGMAPDELRVTRDRCLGAGAAGAVGGALGLVVGGGIALGVAEIIKVSDPANTSASRQFGAFAIPLGAIAGGVAGLAIGTIGAWELGEDLAGKPPVTR